MGIGLIILLIAFFFAIGFEQFTHSNPNDRDLLVWNDTKVTEWDKMSAGRIITQGDPANERTLKVSAWEAVVIYESSDTLITND